MKYKFDWTEFTEDALERCNKEAGEFEDEIYGFILLKKGDNSYIIDIHYEYFNSKDKGFDLEVYTSNEKTWNHYTWLGSIHNIRSAKNYKRFCKRAEDLIIEFLNLSF